jgi:putative membrane protein
VEGFHVAGFSSALWGALIVSLTNMIMSGFLAPPRPPRTPPPAGPAKRDDVIDI